MRLSLGLALLFAFAAAATAKPAPFDYRPAAPRVDDGAIYLGPAGAMIEGDYFKVARPQAGATRIFPCAFHLRVTRGRALVAQSCD